jgi:hypothetical protein
MVGRSEGKRILARSRWGWEDDMRMYLEEMGGGGMD